eukprot:EG_transcript_3663
MLPLAPLAGAGDPARPHRLRRSIAVALALVGCVALVLGLRGGARATRLVAGRAVQAAATRTGALRWPPRSSSAPATGEPSLPAAPGASEPFAAPAAPHGPAAVPWTGLAALLGAALAAVLALRQRPQPSTPLWAMATTTGASDPPMLVVAPGLPSWDALQQRVLATPTGQHLQRQVELRAVGEGDPHIDTALRLFGRPESDIRVTLYRDTAGWCPYCQKVWMLFEEKRIPYRTVKINMRSYGDKPAWFLNKIPSGLLPVIEIDGKMITESLDIIQLLDSMYAAQPPEMVPTDDGLRKKAEELLRLERRLFGDWCSLIFRPSGLFGGADGPKKNFETTLQKVDTALGATEGPWFLGGADPSLVDLQYVSHVERMLASCLYWKGMKIRRSGKYPNLDRWFDAFELRPSYQATKSDYYTHVMDIPPQYGQGFFDVNDEVKVAREYLEGGSWRLPLALSEDSLEPLTAPFNRGEEAARLEAAFKLCRNHEAVVRFAARGCGKPGSKKFQAPLADPYAVPNDHYLPDVDALLRSVVQTLLDGNALTTYRQGPRLVKDGIPFQDRQNLVKCLEYLRDRVGVPRDMGFPAAMQLRAHLNEAVLALGGRP